MKSLIPITLIPIYILCALSSCIVPESTHVKPTFHLLSKTTFDQNQTTTSSVHTKEGNNSQHGHPFYLRQIELPYYLQENRIVNRPRQGEIEFRENDRWGEPLIEGIGRVVGLNLSQILNSPFYSVYPHRKKIGARSGKVNNLGSVQASRGADSIIKDEVVALSDSLGVLSQLICRSIVSSNL